MYTCIYIYMYCICSLSHPVRPFEPPSKCNDQRPENCRFYPTCQVASGPVAATQVQCATLVRSSSDPHVETLF